MHTHVLHAYILLPHSRHYPFTFSLPRFIYFSFILFNYPSLTIEWPFRDPFKLYFLISHVSSGRIPGRLSCADHLPEEREVLAYREVSIWRHPSD